MRLTKKQIFPRFSFSYSRYFFWHVLPPNSHSRDSITITISDQFVPQRFDSSWLALTMATDMMRTVALRSKKHRVKVLALIIALVHYSNSIRRCMYLSRSTILPPSAAPWHHLLHNGDAPSFLLMTGLTREAFKLLHDVLKPPGHPLLPKRRGRKRSLSSEGQLGLLLFYISSTMNYKHLCLIFGITLNACSRMLRNMLKLAVRQLRFHHLARIKFPSAEKMQMFASMVQSRENYKDQLNRKNDWV